MDVAKDSQGCRIHKVTEPVKYSFKGSNIFVVEPTHELLIAELPVVRVT